MLRPGTLCGGQAVHVVERRDHDVTVGLVFRALTTERDLRPRLLAEPRPRASVRETAVAQAQRAGTR